MYLQTFPEDSILRRHFDSTTEMKRELWLQTPPSDSVLRRHAKTSDNTHNKPDLQVIPGLKTINNADASSIQEVSGRNGRSEEKGLFTWLFRLFKRSA